LTQRRRVEKEKEKEVHVLFFLDGWKLGSNIELTSEDDDAHTHLCNAMNTPHTERERKEIQTYAWKL